MQCNSYWLKQTAEIALTIDENADKSRGQNKVSVLSHLCRHTSQVLRGSPKNLLLATALPLDRDQSSALSISFVVWGSLHSGF